MTTPSPLRTLLLAALAALAAVAAPSAGAQSRAASAPTKGGIRATAGRPLDADGSVRVFLLDGSVRVTGWNRDSVAVSGTIAAGHDLFIGGTRRGIKLGAWNRADARDDAPSQLEVHVPARSRVWVKAGYGADVVVSGVTGGLDLSAVSGEVRVAGSPRELTVESMDGDVLVEGSPAWLRAKTATGAITVRGTPEDVGLTTVRGPITVAGQSFARAKFESVTGDIAFTGTPARGGALDFDTHSGLVDLRLPAALDAEFDVTTIAGSVENAISDARQVAEPRRKELSFTAGDGGARITARTFKGTVLLRRQ